MSQRFKAVAWGANDERAKVYAEPQTGAVIGNVYANGFLLKIEDAAETEDWIKVESYATRFDPPRTGWVPRWVLGDPIDDAPEIIQARSLAIQAARSEADMAAAGELTVSAEYLLALFLIENGLDGGASPVFDDNTTLQALASRSDPDAVGGYAIATTEWQEFLGAEGAALGWNKFARLLTLPQMRCLAYLTRRDWAAVATLRGGTPSNPALPRKLDLFIARLVGPEAAAEIARREQANEIGASALEVVRAARHWNAGSPQENALMALRKRFMADSGGSPVDLRFFLEGTRQALNAGLAIGYQMLETYLPSFVAAPAAGGAMARWYELAERELDQWTQENWTEHTEPGQSRALSFFSATDHPGGRVEDGGGEITHWCGAFVAHFVHQGGATPPSGAAAAANWVNWGDVGYPVKQDGTVPLGAVVTTAGGEGTDKVSHVCFFAGWSGTNQFLALGGNQSDGVTKTPMSSDSIVSIRGIADRTSAGDDDTEILAKTLYGEIRGGRDEQKRNVANVILNRFLTGYRSNGSISGTCLSPQQFSCWNAGTNARRTLDGLRADDQTLAGLRQIAHDVINDRLQRGPTYSAIEGARHYHNHNVNPNWAVAEKMVLDDGSHKFYKDIA